MQDQKSILVICVNYNSPNAAVRYIKSISNTSKERVHVDVVLVDNSEDTDSEALFEALKQEDPNIECIKAPSNPGYFGGAHYGLKIYLETHDLPDWIVVSNVDLVIEDGMFFERLAELELSDRVGIIAPSIWSNHWRMDRNPKMLSRPAVKTMHRYKLIYRNYVVLIAYQALGRIKSLLRKKLGNNSPSLVRSLLKPVESQNGFEESGIRQDILPIYAPHGSLMIFSKRFFTEGGDINYPCFLFMEEIYVAEIARRLNLDVVYVPTLRIIHNDHVSTGIIRSPQMARHMYDSAVYIADKYFC